MSDKSIYDAIMARDLNAVTELIDERRKHSDQFGLCTCGKIFEPLSVFHGIGCGYRVKPAAEARKLTNCADCRDTGRVERNIDGCDVEVECVMCAPQYGLRARLSLEQRDEPRQRGYSNFDSETNIRKSGEI